jgi:ligand-binding sensor domain-containing protein/signal transduction histidine kinase
LGSHHFKFLRILSGQFEELNMLKNRWALRLAWLWLCGFGCLFSANADVSKSGSPFIVDVWSTEEGLPQSSVISVIQTKDGYLWLGTLNGLVRFDGNHFTVFDQNNTPGLSSDRIVYLFEDSQTNLWVGTESAGLNLIKGGKVKNFNTGNGTGENRVIYAYEDSTDDIWFYAADGHFFSCQNGKMIFYDPSIFPAQLFKQAVKINIPSQSGGFWRMENGSIQKWGNNQLEKDFGACPWTNAPVTAACEDANGNLIVGTLGAGVFWFDANGKYECISKDDGLSSAYVLSLCMDREGNLWVGTDGGGLDRIKRKVFFSPAELHSWAAQSLSEDAQGGLWAAFGALGASYWSTNSVQDFRVGRGQDAWEALVDQQQQVWIGTRDDGLFLFQTNHFIPAPGAEVLGPQIFALFENHSGQLWAGAQNGLGCWNGQNWKIYTARDGLSENVIRAIAEDTNGNFWIGTESHGLDFFQNGKFISYRKSENGLPGDDISCLYLDKEGALWVGTFGHGLARFQNGKWTRYSTDDGLASNSVGYIIEDDDGNLWIGSNAGLMRIQKKSLNDFAGGTTNVISCRTYGKTDGLPTRECSSGSQPAACRTLDGRIWFPTTKGLVSVNPAELKPNLQPPLVMIESVLVDGREQKTNRLDSAWAQSIVIPPGREQLEIDYTALNFSAPDAVRFKYRLEGRDTAWTGARAERVANYSNLSPGHYFFHVTAENEDGVWNETGSVLEITVLPQFWQTNWFRIVTIIFLLGIVVAIVRFISTQKLRREVQLFKQQEALEKERGRIARDLHDQLGANLTQVALLGEMAEADKNSPDEIESHAKQISETARETTRSLDEIVWAVNPSNDTLEGLANYACKYAQEYLALAGLRYRADLPVQLPPTPIPPEVRHNVFLAFKESVNNVVKHAQASEVWIRLRLQPDSFTLEIEDNGRGIGNQAAPQNRNGLRNMRKRMEDIRGEFSISGGANGGTVVRLKIPLAKKSV